MVSSSDKHVVLHISFNQDCTCFAVGTDHGFKVFRSNPLRLIFERGMHQVEFNGGLGLTELVYKCNLVALVGGGTTPRYPSNKVMLWDDHQMRCIGEICFRSEVKGVRLRRDCIVVALVNKLYVYTLADLHLKDHQETWHNTRGLCCLSTGTDIVLAYPERVKGHIRVILYSQERQERSVSIEAHESAVACMAISQDGAFVASASDKGTLIRVSKSEDGTLLQEVRRGIDRADICSLIFDQSTHWLACSSDKGTVHIFAVKQTQEEERRSSFVKKLLPKYFDSEWSFAKFSVPEAKTVCGFGETQGTVIGDSYAALSLEGNYYLATFDTENRGEALVRPSQTYLELLRD